MNPTLLCEPQRRDVLLEGPDRVTPGLEEVHGGRAPTQRLEPHGTRPREAIGDPHMDTSGPLRHWAHEL